MKLAALWVALQVLLLAGWAWREEGRQAEGTLVLVQPEPVDPRDLLRGQYLELRYAFSSPARLGELAPDAGLLESGQEVWVRLGPQDGLHVPLGASLERPGDLAPDEVALRGRVEGWQCLFGIERYYVPEGSETPAVGDTLVELRIGDDGEARIEGLFVNGQRWP